MKRRTVVSPRSCSKSVKASDGATVRNAKKNLLYKMQAAFDALEDHYDELKYEYQNEMDSLYEELELFVRELDSDVN